MADDLAALGAPADIVAAWRSPPEPPSFAVWPENWPIVRAFLAAQTQWRVLPLTAGYAARPVYLGLDMAGAEAAIRLAGLKRTPELLWGLQVMEAEAVRLLNRNWT